MTRNRPEAPFLERAWRLLAGRHAETFGAPTPTLPELLKSEWCPRFELLMRNRMILGALRYGCLGAKGKRKYDRVGSAMRRLKCYMATGNREHLVDAACLLMVEFVEGTHPTAHWAPGDDGEHTRERLQ